MGFNFGDVLGPVLGFAGGIINNDQNRHLSHDMANRNSEEAFELRKWQERMSNTAHQREVKDLEMAGLNPLLGISQSGASTPGGASGSGTAPQMEDAIGKAVTTAIEAKTLKLAMDKQKEEIESLRAQRTNTEANTAKTRLDSETSKAVTARTRVETERAKKDIPKSEMINDLYDVVRPVIKRMKGDVQRSPKQSNDAARQQFYEMTGKRLP